jgi:excisionase family DNA binding protein
VAQASARGFGHRLPSEQERGAADHLRRILAEPAEAGRDQSLTLLGESGRRADVVLTPPMARLLMEMLRHIGRGDGVTLVPVSQMLTTQQAADILNVSRPFLVSLLEQDRLPHTLVGRHRRIRAEDLFDYKRRRDQTRSDALAELAALDADLI